MRCRLIASTIAAIIIFIMACALYLATRLYEKLEEIDTKQAAILTILNDLEIEEIEYVEN